MPGFDASIAPFSQSWIVPFGVLRRSAFFNEGTPNLLPEFSIKRRVTHATASRRSCKYQLTHNTCASVRCRTINKQETNRSHTCSSTITAALTCCSEQRRCDAQQATSKQASKQAKMSVYIIRSPSPYNIGLRQYCTSAHALSLRKQIYTRTQATETVRRTTKRTPTTNKQTQQHTDRRDPRTSYGTWKTLKLHPPP